MPELKSETYILNGSFGIHERKSGLDRENMANHVFNYTNVMG